MRSAWTCSGGRDVDFVIFQGILLEFLICVYAPLHIAQCLSWWRWTRWARPCGRNTLSLGARSSSAVSWPTTGRTLRFPSGRAAAPTAVAVGGWSTKEIKEGNYSTFFRKLFNFLGIQEKIFQRYVLCTSSSSVLYVYYGFYNSELFKFL